MKTKRCPVCGQEVEVIAGRLAFHYRPPRYRYIPDIETRCEGSDRRVYPRLTGEMLDDYYRDTYGVPYDDELRAGDEIMERRIYGEPFFSLEEEAGE